MCELNLSAECGSYAEQDKYKKHNQIQTIRMLMVCVK